MAEPATPRQTRPNRPTVSIGAITTSEHTSHNSSEPSSDPVENVVSAMPVVLPVVGGIMMFLLALIAVKMA